MSAAKYKRLEKSLSFSLQELSLEIDKWTTETDWVRLKACKIRIFVVRSRPLLLLLRLY